MRSLKSETKQFVYGIEPFIYLEHTSGMIATENTILPVAAIALTRHKIQTYCLSEAKIISQLYHVHSKAIENILHL